MRGAAPTDELVALRARRTDRRTAKVEPFDAFYQAYITALISGFVVIMASGSVGDGSVASSTVSRIATDGPSWAALLLAIAAAFGLRSGSRGGPLALEAPDVQHVLLGPVAIGPALRGPALRQARYVTFCAAVIGAVIGHLASTRLPGGAGSWMLVMAAYAVLLVMVGVTAAWLAASRRLSRPVATVLAGLLVLCVAWGTVADGPPTPLTTAGRLAVWPLHGALWSLAFIPMIVGLAFLGLASLGGISLERTQRRTVLVEQLRFAATMRDLRTVMLLRRQLTQEQSRQRPWLRSSRLSHRTIVVQRDWRALLRTPASRLIRMLSMGVIAAAAARGAWNGTSPLILVAGGAMFLVALDALEPLSQEVDHPSLLALTGVARGRVHALHLVVPTLLVLSVGAVGLAFSALLGLTPTGIGVGAFTLVAASATAVAGAAINIVRDEGDSSGGDSIAMLLPEAAGMRLVYRTAGPPVLAAVGFVPVLLARSALLAGRDPVAGASSALVPLLALSAGVAAWLRFRDELRAWWQEASEQSRPSTNPGEAQ